MWHKKMTYLNFQSLYNLSYRKIVTNIPILLLIRQACEACILKKHHKHVIPKSNITLTTRLFEIVHSNLCGPLPLNSLFESQYILTFIDDFLENH